MLRGRGHLRVSGSGTKTPEVSGYPVNLQTTGDLGRVDDFVCEHERMLIPTADRVAETLWRERAPMFVQKHYNAGFALLSLIEDRS